MTARQCGASCVKGMFMVFNFVLWISGLALLTVGVLAKTKFARYMKLSTEIDYDIAPYIMIGCGVFIVLVGFCGCWASMKEHGWALKIYMGILVILFLTECGGAIAGYVMRKKLHDGLTKGFNQRLENYRNNSQDKEMIDEVQGTLIHCCGTTGYKDWSQKNNATAASVPISCCKTDCKATCTLDGNFCPANTPNDTSKLYTTGCVEKIESLAKKNFMIIGGVALGIAVLQLLGVFCAFCLTKLIKENAQYDQFA